MTRLRNLDDEVMEAPFDKRQFLRLLSYLKPYKKQMIIALCLMIIASGASLVGPYLLSRAIGYLQDGIYTQVPYLFIGMALALFVGGMCLRARVRTMDTAGRKAIASLRQDLFNHIQDLSLPFFDAAPPARSWCALSTM